VCEEILRRVRRYSSTNKDIPFKTPPPFFFYLQCNYAIFCITTTLKQHENTGSYDQLVKCKSFNEISIMRWIIMYTLLSFIINEFCSRFVMAVPFILPTAALPSRVSQKEIFLLEFYFKFISILHRVNN
jgi:hypothetical protein